MAKNHDEELDIMEVDSDFFEEFEEDLDGDIIEESDEIEDEEIEDEEIEEVLVKAVDNEPYDIKNHKLLSHEETVELLKKAQAGDSSAKDTLVERNIRLVKSISKSFPVNSILSKSDLIQEGVIGLMKAINKFDLKKGYMFSTYATWWIRQAMQRALSDNVKAIKVPVYLQEELVRIRRVQKALTQKYDRAPTAKEISKEVKVDCACYDKIVNHDFFETLVGVVDLPDDRREIEGIIIEDLEFSPDAEIVLKSIAEFIKKKHRVPTLAEVDKDVNLDVKRIKYLLEVDTNSNVSSLNIPVTDDFNSCYGDNIASDENVETTVNQKIISEGLIKALDEVYGSGKHSRENYMKTHCKADKKNYDPTGENFIPWNELMKYRYGIGGYQKETLEQLGKRYNISRERVRQIEKNILGIEVGLDKDGKPKLPKQESIIFKRKIKEYCGFDISDF